MATSSYSYLEKLGEYLVRSRGKRKSKTKLTKKVLDIGLGFGKNGYIIREYLELWRGNDVSPSTWKSTIHGIEAYRPYIHSWQRDIYDEVFIGNALTVLPRLPNYDFIIMTDVLEHFEKEDGFKMLDLIKEKSNDFFITTPQNPSKQGAVNGNEYERHRSVFTIEELQQYGVVDVQSDGILLLRGGDV